MSLLAHHRPRGAAEILDASARIYRAHVGVLLVISIAVVLPPAILRALLPSDLGNAISLAGNLLVPFAQGAIILFVSALLEEGKELSVGEAYGRLGKHGGGILGVQLMTGILIMLGLLLFIIPGIVAIAWTAVAGPVVVLEGMNGGDALSRSRALARGQMKHILGTLLLAWFIVIVLMVGASFVVGLLAAVVGLDTTAIDFISEMLFAPVLPLIAIPVALLYYDLRIRNEGADIDAMVAELPAMPVALPEQS